MAKNSALEVKGIGWFQEGKISFIASNMYRDHKSFALKENHKKSLGNDLSIMIWDGGQINLTIETN